MKVFEKPVSGLAPTIKKPTNGMLRLMHSEEKRPDSAAVPKMLIAVARSR